MNGFSSLIFTDINRSVISAAYRTSNKYLRGLFETLLWRPGVYSKPGVKSRKYGTLKALTYAVYRLTEINRLLFSLSFLPSQLHRDSCIVSD